MKEICSNLINIKYLFFDEQKLIRKGIVYDIQQNSRTECLNRAARRRVIANGFRIYPEAISIIRSGAYESFKSVMGSLILGIVIGIGLIYIFNKTFGLNLYLFIFIIKIFSYIILAFATLNRLQEAKFFDGTTLIEKTSKNLFKYIFCLGLTVNVLILTLDTFLKKSL
ncbi:MAG: hypothetical protein KME38_30705 [Spirirestis rafaelensis WJT71-NPBG6]|jgi:hypothetical protein|nr:hypothetical protein [Spirirestis rafaelensis WJT71-NPBG6]